MESELLPPQAAWATTAIKRTVILEEIAQAIVEGSVLECRLEYTTPSGVGVLARTPSFIAQREESVSRSDFSPVLWCVPDSQAEKTTATCDCPPQNPVVLFPNRSAAPL